MNKKRILIVDDEISFARLLKLNLELTQLYEVQIEQRADDALAAARQFQPDLLLLDVMMPGMLGGEVAAQIRAVEEFKQLPIVFITAAVRKERLAEHGGVLSGYPVLAKPVSVEEVVAFLARILAPEKAPDVPSTSALNH